MTLADAIRQALDLQEPALAARVAAQLGRRGLNSHQIYSLVRKLTGANITKWNRLLRAAKEETTA